ncbi:MAG TPA: DNA repair protein RecN [Beijerinckiaceae bacterium]|nr:DNA repair protein RecN [Beijerinckiaceae bacterium]
MLVQLSIRDIILIDRLDLQLGSGLTVLTGETGAGKSILLDAFALALGARGDGSLVREGQTQGQVVASFEVPPEHPACAAARRNDIETGGDLILRRVQFTDGRTRAFVNDQPVSAQAVRAIAAELVEIHGQHDDRALIDPTHHRFLIDTFGGLLDEAQNVREAHANWRKASAKLADEEARIAKARSDADYLRHAHAELDRLAVEPGEEDQLATRRATMMQAEKVVGDLVDAQQALADDHAPTAALGILVRRLERRAAQAPSLIEPCVKALDAAIDALESASQALDHAVRSAEFDPHELERIEERLFALRAAARKYAVAADALPTLALSFARDLEALDAGEAQLVALAAAVRQAEQTYVARAAALSTARKRAAARLEKAVNAELAPLKLERARFIAQLESDPALASPDGIDRVEFWVQTNPGTRPGPLMKVASGGELARFMLALKVALADRGSAPTLVFDEIDTGVGGAVADAIGQRLARLAKDVQVLAVTHAPQVAARALGHFRIAKDALGKGRRVATRVTQLEAISRREEIARMLAGATITDEARAAAGRLLEGAG